MPPAASPEENSKLEVLQLKSVRATAALNYVDCFRLLRLTPAQIEQFLVNFVARYERQMDLHTVAQQQDEAGKLAVAKFQQEADLAYDAAQTELLGADGFRQLQDYQRTLSLRNALVRGLAGGTTLAGIPISAEQSDRLVAAALDAMPRDEMTRTNPSLAKVDWAAFDVQARGILTPAQFTFFVNELPPVGYQSHLKYRLDAAVAKAQQADKAAANSPTKNKPGS